MPKADDSEIVDVPGDYLDGMRPRGPKKGKYFTASKWSELNRNELVALYAGGHLPASECIPSSIMGYRKKGVEGDEDGAIADGRRYSDSLPDYNKNGLASARDAAVRSMHSMNSGSLNGALSRFPQQIGRSIVLFYTAPGSVVVDPFAGHNSRMELCVKAGMDYVGFDLSTEFMKHNRRRREQLLADPRYADQSITLYHQDSRSLQPVPDDYGDFTITSPPYYDTEYYGDELEQMGNCPTYESFLDEMRKVMTENHRVLRPGAFAVWFINDFCRDNQMLFYHNDIMNLGKDVGFVPHDILIVDLGRSIRDAFVVESHRSKRLPKRHEYGVVLRKPS